MSDGKGARNEVKMEVPKEVAVLLKKTESLQLTENKLKVKCSLSGHEMPLKADAIKCYLSGKKFQKLLEKDTFEKKQKEKYQEHLVPSTKKWHEKQLFCLLTLRHVNNEPRHIQRHLEGRRFKKALAKWEECKKTGQKFQPRPHHKRQHSDSESEKEGQAVEKEDDLTDLYPVEDFASDNDTGAGEASSEVELESLEENGPDEIESSEGSSAEKETEAAVSATRKKGTLKRKPLSKMAKVGPRRKKAKTVKRNK